MSCRHLCLVAPLWFERGHELPAQRLARLDAERMHLLALATGEHALPHEIAMRVAALTGELQQLTAMG